ncbi:uncharacterized protein LOC141904568 isoform X2 [Tubulanus polymorphus]
MANIVWICGICVELLLLLQTVQTQSQLDNCLPSSCHVTENVNSPFGSTKTCFCDRQCYIHGDCCYDAANTGRSTPALRDLFENHLQCSGYAEKVIPTHTWFVKTCPDQYRDYFVKSLCEDKYDTPDEYVRWPVSGSLTGLTYRNMYCAMCWHEATFKYWKLRVNCREKRPQSKSETIDLNNNGLNALRDDRYFCTREYTSPIDTDHVRSCYFGKIVNTCSNITNKSNVIGCKERTTNMVSQMGTNTSYRNKYCALCNGVDETKLTCPFHNAGFRSVFAGRQYPLTILFDLNIGKASVRTSSATKDSKLICSRSEVYDSLTGTCRQVRCGIGYKFQDGRCKFDETASTEFAAMSGGRGMVSMKERCAIVTYQKGEYVLRSDGILIVTSLGTNYTADEYRFSTNGTIDVCVNDTGVLNATSAEQIFPSLDGVAGVITTIGQSISIVCLTLLLIIYSVLPTLRNVPGKSVMCLSAALLVGQLFFLVGPSAADNHYACVSLAVAIHFMFLSVFTWMNVLAVDLASTFWSTKLVSRPDPASQRRRYVKFAAYAFSLPLSVVVVGAILDVFAKNTAPYNPSYGTKLCWMNSGSAVGILFILPVSVLLLVNCCMYSLTIRGIYTASKAAKMVRKSDKTNLYLYMKLSVVLGGTWIFAFVWMLHRNIVIQYIYIILNSLQGLAVFVAFVCRAKVARMLRLLTESRTTSSPNKDASASTRLTLLNTNSSVNNDVTIRGEN